MIGLVVALGDSASGGSEARTKQLLAGGGGFEARETEQHRHDAHEPRQEVRQCMLMRLAR